MFKRIRAFMVGAMTGQGAATMVAMALPVALLCVIGSAPHNLLTPDAAAASSDPFVRDGGVPVDQIPSSNDDPQDADGADLPDAASPVDPNWINTLAPGESCGTYQRYLAELAALGINPLDGVCPGNGPCDDPLNRNTAIPTGDTPIKTCRLSIHVFCNKRGSDCATSQAVVDAAVAALNTHYAPWRIQFIYQTNFIKDDKYRVLDAGEEGPMKRRYADSPGTKLNVYVVDSGGVSWGTFPWDPQALTYMGGIVLHQTAIGGSWTGIFTHEVGHCIGLWHTYHGVTEVPQCGDCYEPAGRTPAQGDVTGDLCSDTAPTPRNYSCSDPGTIDPCSGLPWGTTPLTNFMSTGITCQTEFTPQQAGRMHCWTNGVLTGWLQ
jgi:hypothetical protein